MASKAVTNLLDLYHADIEVRSPWLQFWQRIYDLHSPNRADFTEDHGKGQSRVSEIYDSTPRLSARSLRTSIGSLLHDKSSQWFWMTVDDDDLMDDDEIKLHLEVVRRRMWKAVYDVRSRFVQRSGEVDGDLVLAGIGYLWIGMNEAQSGLSFKSYHPAKATIREDADGVINATNLTSHFTASQAVKKYGLENVGKLTQEAFDGTAKDRAKKFEFVQMIMPREDHEVRRFGNQNMPYSSVTLDIDSEKIIKEGGFREFPLAIPRWETSPDEVYTRGPAAYAAPDGRTLNAMTKTLLVGGQMAVDPPKWATSDGVLSPFRTFPGGLTIIDGEAAKEMRGPPIGQLDLTGNIPLGREMQQDYRNNVEKAFMKDIFRLPTQGPEMTAAEIFERKEEYLREIGPVSGRLGADYMGHTTMRVYALMERAGAFPPKPEKLEGVPIEFEYINPAEIAKRQLDAAGFSRAMEVIAPAVEFYPDVLDNFNFDAVARDSPQYTGMPQRWINDQEGVDETREKRAKQREAQQQAEAADQGAGTVEKLGRAAASAASAGLSPDAAQ